MSARSLSAFLILIAVAAAAAGVGFASRHSAGVAKTERPAEAPIPVTAATVIQKDVPIVIRALGAVQPIESVAVQARVSGQVMQAFFKQGQMVKAGDPLFLIDPRPYEATLDQQQAQLERDQALLAEARTDLARYQELLKENSIAKQQAADQAYLVQEDEGTVKVDQANVENARLNLDYAHINAPATGIAGAMQVDPGNYVQGGAGATMVTITQLSPIYVTFPVPQTQLDKVRAAQAKAPLTARAFSERGKPLGDGALSFINNQVVATTGAVTLYAAFPNGDQALWPGEFVTVELVLGMRRGAVTAPLESVMSGPRGDYVYTISADNAVHRAPVLVAARQGGLAVVAKGLSPGERVVVNGQYRLADKAKVAIEPPAAAGSAAP